MLCSAKVSPRRLLAKPDKMSSTGKSKQSIVDYNNSLPTYPALMSCDVPVDTIIPDLISSPMYVTDHTLTTPNYFLTTPTTGQEVLVHFSMLGRSEQWGNWRLFQRIRLLGVCCEWVMCCVCPAGEVFTHTAAKASDSEEHSGVICKTT